VYEKENGESRNPIWSSLWKSVAYNPITLINATAQLALAEHLDDELSKQLSVAKNTMVARQMTEARQLSPAEHINEVLQYSESYLKRAALFDPPQYVILQELGKNIEHLYHVNVRALLKESSSMRDIPEEEVMLTPNDLAKRLGVPSGASMNQMLAKLGWQRRVGKEWEPTAIGAQYSYRKPWTSEHSTKTGFHYAWKVVAVQAALQKHELTAEED
jgi:hypothetical protein